MWFRLKHVSILLISLLFLLVSCAKDEGVNVELDTVSVRITSPFNLESLPPNRSVEFTGEVRVEDPNDFSSLKVIWESDIDGILHKGGVDSNGLAKFTSNGLSKNIHYIRLYVYNLKNESIFDQTIVYNAIWLYEISNDNNNSKIYWSKTEDTDFESYELYRSYNKYSLDQKEGSPIYTTTDVNDTTYNDTEALLGNKHFYKAFIKRKTNTHSYIGSNKDSIIPGDFIDLDYPIYKVINDPTRNYAYGIVNVESIYSSNKTGYGLVFINTTKQEVEKRILTNIRFTDLDIDPSGHYLYLCSRSQIIHKINLNTQNFERTLVATRSAHKIEVGIDRLYYHMTPPTSGATEFRIYDLLNNTNIAYNSTMTDAYSSFSHGDFELGENGILYHGGSNSSSASLSKISTENDVFSLPKQWDSRNYQKALITLNNNKLYWNQYLIDTDLNVLGQFLDNGDDVDIEAVAPNGTLALGWRRLFKTENQTIVKKIPVNYDVATFLNNNYLLLINNENPISNENNSRVFFYKL
ncbi:hypothetical protein [Algibacter sp. 2305UL17-15]|uniref:hypothetical protein n=1 Tax=Algibacter sp. 2305UL17-15 TaxID=3231268 RepID=UPI0034579393